MKRLIFLPFTIALVLGFRVLTASTENINPDNDESKYAYSEENGWFDCEIDVGSKPGIEVKND